MKGKRTWFVGGLVVGMLLAGEVAVGLAEPGATGPQREGASLDAQPGGGAVKRPSQGISYSEWQWDYRRFVNVGPVEPVRLSESVRVGFANRGDSYVRVTFRAASKEGFAEGSFRGRKAVSFVIERIYDRVVIRGKRFIARSSGAFRLVESDPPGPTLGEFSTLGGIARGKNMVAVVEEAFGGENLFALDGENLSFVNQQANGDNARAFPKEIVLEPVK